MNRNTLVGIVAGLGIAVAGGVAGLTLMGGSSDSETLVAEEVQTGSAEVTAAPQAQPAVAAAAPVVQQPKMVEECWDEEVEVPAEPRDDKAIAGTAAGAVIGGALADRLGDDDDLVTAAGAAAGAFLGRKAQREYQENRTTTTTVRRCQQVAAR